MSTKNLDSKGRLRNKIVSFRMSPQEAISKKPVEKKQAVIFGMQPEAARL